MADEQVKQDARAYIEREWENIVADVATLVSIRSVEDMEHATEGMPYGPKPYEALCAACDIAERMGFDTHNCDGHIAYADIPGASKKQLALIGHTDIVPEGTGWTFPPFEVTRKDGYMIGRGVLDDKGPLVMGMYAAKFFKEQADKTGEPLPYTIRCIIGNNEETDMRDVEWYIENFEQPAFLFTPDADFPVICGEKGGYSATIRPNKAIADQIVSFEGGTAGNAVPGQAIAIVRADASKLTAADRIEVEDLGDGTVRIVATGIGAHASTPEGSVNAILVLVDYLLENGIGSEAEHRFLELDHKVLCTTDGSSMGFASRDEMFGPLTCIGGTIRTKDGIFEQTIDSRYPTSISSDEISAAIEKVLADYDANLTVDLDMPTFYIKPDNPAIQTCVDTYNEYTGRDSKAYVIGGGTYARHFKCACAFGPNDPAFPMPDWIGAEHSADEGFSEEQFKKALEIYIVAMSRLMKLDL